MRKLVKKYIISIYDDFSIETEEEQMEADSFRYERMSSRMAQILMVIRKIADTKHADLEENLEDALKVEIYNDAIKEVAKEQRVVANSVIDKLTRQIKMNSEGMRNMIFDALQSGDYANLEELLSKNASNRNPSDDYHGIELFFQSLRDRM